jgi:hypothetical protein
MTETNLNQPQNPQPSQSPATPTIADLEASIIKPKEQKASYIILSLLFPPFTIYLALFLSWRRKLLFRTLPIQLIFYSAITLVFNIIGLLPISPPQQVTQLGVAVESKINGQVVLWTVITTVLAFICLAAGYYYRKRAKKDGMLDTSSLWILFLFLNLLVFGVILLVIKEASLLFSSISPAINSGYSGL